MNLNVVPLKEMRLKNKSPVSELNEIMSIYNKKIDYQIVSIKKNKLSIIFNVSACNGEIIAFGSDSELKKAEINAAIAFLKQINCNDNNYIITLSMTNIQRTEQTQANENPLEIINCNNSYNLFSSVVDHPIEELHSLCYALHWRLPAYQFIEGPQDSLTVKLTYTVGCIIFTVKAIGQGTKKKIAKQQAAINMYGQIRNMSKMEINYICENECRLNRRCRKQIRNAAKIYEEENI